MRFSTACSRQRLRRPLALLFCCGLFAGSLAWAETQAPALTPRPRELHVASRLPVRSANILVPGDDAEDVFAAGELGKVLSLRGIVVAPSAGAADLSIMLLRRESAEAGALLAKSNLAFDPAMHDEGYVIVSQPGRVAIVAETAAGVFYGAQTLGQMVESDAGVPQVWTGTVRDWPAMKYRGIHDDLSRGPFPTLAFQNTSSKSLPLTR